MKQLPTKPVIENCGCCEGLNVLTPVEIFNRPGLEAIVYRVGAHGSFLETMKSRLSSRDFLRLAGLTARDAGDASIALLDAWATVADVLTFYQERIANEGYLRTATERRSILELARLIGYRLRPGVASSVYLAYTIEPTQEKTTIEPGNRAQSLPGPGELPQVFETAERLEAYSNLNLMKPRLAEPQFFRSVGEIQREIKVYLQGTSTNLRINDVVTLTFTPASVGVRSYRVVAVKPEAGLSRTAVTLVSFLPTPAVQVVTATFAPPLLPTIQAIAEKYLKIEDFSITTTGKMVERVTGLLTGLQELPAGTANEELVAELKGKVLPQLADEYSLATTRGYDKLTPWILGMKDEFEAALHTPFSVSNPAGLLVEEGDSNHENPKEPETPTFATVLGAFKVPPSIQPANAARLLRPSEQIYSIQSGFVPQVLATIQPRIGQFATAALKNFRQQDAALLAPGPGPIFLTKVEAMRTKATLAGHGFPSVFVKTGNGNDIVPVSPPIHEEYRKALIDADLIILPTSGLGELSVIALDTEYDQIKTGDKVVIARPKVDGNDDITTDLKVTTHNVRSAKAVLLTFNVALSIGTIKVPVPVTVTVLTLDSPWLDQSEQDAFLKTNALIRRTTVYLLSEQLTPVERPIDDAIEFSINDPNPLIELEGFYSGLEPGRWVIISGDRLIPDPRRPNIPDNLVNTGVKTSELLMVDAVFHEEKMLIDGTKVGVVGEKLHTFIRFAQAPAYSYERNTVRIYGNVVRATHGETRDEFLGSGDGSQELQSFQLKQSPLTYLPAPTTSGVQSTLEVFVNDIRWREAGNLFTLNRTDRRYITRAGDDGKTTIVFGSGEHGARLPTGAENVRAVYRSGIGKDGNVSAEQIKLPLTRPLGVKDVINPTPASGGADRESRNQARRNAPIGTLALDRLVSIQDYADFARTFAGIGKASARRMSDGKRDIVHLTIAGAGDVLIDPTSDLYRNLVAALKRFGDPFQPFDVDVLERVLLMISAKIKIDPDFLWEPVESKIRNALLARFGFENRELGQDVPNSEVLSVIQSVPGVVYVDLDLLDVVGEAKLSDPNFSKNMLSLRPRVNSELARFNKVTNVIEPAQLVFLSPAAKDTLILEEVTG